MRFLRQGDLGQYADEVGPSRSVLLDVRGRKAVVDNRHTGPGGDRFERDLDRVGPGGTSSKSPDSQP